MFHGRRSSYLGNCQPCCAVLKALVHCITCGSLLLTTEIFRDIVQIVRGKLDVDVQLENHDYNCDIRPVNCSSHCPPKPTPYHPGEYGKVAIHGRCSPIADRSCVKRPFVYEPPPPCRKGYF